jgi:hypothetical protein
VLDGLVGAVALVGVHHAVAVTGVRIDDDDLHPRRQRHGRCIQEVDLHDGDHRVDGQFAHPGECALDACLGGG